MDDKNHAVIAGIKIAWPRKPHDPDICPYCQNYQHCLHPCYPSTWIDGQNELHEVLLRDPIDQQPSSDYNETLAEIMNDKEARDADRLEAIRSIDDPRRRLIAAGILAGLTQQQIASIAHISQTRITRIFRGVR